MEIGKWCEGEGMKGVWIYPLTLTVRVLEEQCHGNRNHDATALCSDPVIHLSGEGRWREGKVV